MTPNPRFLYLAESHREAMAHLLYGLEQGEGFIVITGEVGTGKTTICRSLLDRLGAETEVAILFNPSQSASELLQSISEEFDLPAAGLSRRELLSRLNRFLLEKSRESRRVVLIVDEAQNLSVATLEQIRLLSNLETASSKLIQIILLGQPELDEKLDSEDLRQLRQRVSVRWSLNPLPRDDTFGYIRHRLRVAAGAEREILSEGAMREIHRRTAGVPRLINVLTDRVLLAGYAAGAHRIRPKLVRQSAKEVPDLRRRRGSRRGSSGPRSRRRFYAWSAAVAAAAVLAAYGYGWLRGIDLMRGWLDRADPKPIAGELLHPVSSSPDQRRNAPAGWPTAVAELVEAPFQSLETAPPLRDDEVWLGMPGEGGPLARPSPEELAADEIGQGAFLAMLLASGEPGERELHALNAVLGAFQEDGMRALPDSPAALAEELALRGLALETIADAGIERLRQLNYPALLTLRADGDEARVVALIGLDGELAELAGIGPSERLRVPVAALEERWEADPRIIWRPYERIPILFGPGDSGAGVFWLQEALGRLGHLESGISGRYDERTVRSVQEFQRLHGLTPDGVTGPLTLMLLYDELEEYSPPRLVKAPAQSSGEAG